MKHTKFWSCLIAVILLVSCIAGIFVVGADAESTTVYYTLGEVALEGSQHFDTLSEALAALKAKDKKWGANESVEIQFKGDISGGTQDGILFGLTTIWREDGTKLPITFRGVDSITSRDAYIYLDAAGGWYACANDYTFINLTLPVGDQLTEFYAGSGNVRFENVHFKQQNITIPTSAEQAIEHRLMHDVARTVANRNNADLLPAGDAWFDLITNKPDIGDNLSRSLKKDRPEGDYKHDGDIGGGMYLNACVWYEVLTKKSCVGHAWRPDTTKVGYTLDESIVDDLQQAAHDAVVAHYGENYYDDTYSADLNGDGVINILNIGSSNGYYYPDELCQMLTTDGLTARVCTAYHSGVKISTQWTWAAGTAAGDYQFRIFEADTVTSEEISNPDAKAVGFDYFQEKFAWDSITFYQTAGPFDDYGLTESGYDTAYTKILATCEKADDLYAYMRRTNPNARYTWYQVCPNPVGYPGVDSSLNTKSGRFYADNCTQEVFAGWPELKEGEKVKTSLTFGPGTQYYGTYDSTKVKHLASAIGYMIDYEGDPLTDETAAEVTYMEAAASYGTIPDIRPIDVEASLIIDGGTMYRIGVHNGHAPSSGKILMTAGSVYCIDGDNNNSGAQDYYYGDTEIKVLGGNVTGSVYGGYSTHFEGDLIMELGGDAVVGSCIRGTFDTGVVNGDIRMTVSGNAQIKGAVISDGVVHAFYGGGDATGEIVNTISGGTLNGMYFGIRQGGAGKTIVNNITGGTINGKFYGGHYGTTAIGQVINNFSGGAITDDIYAGGRQNSTSAAITGLPTVVDGKTVTASIVNNISGTTFGTKTTADGTTTRIGNFYGSSVNGTVGDVYNIITGGTFYYRFYGSTPSRTVGNVVTKVSGDAMFDYSFYGMGSDANSAGSEGKTVTVDISGGSLPSTYVSGQILYERVSNVNISGGTFKYESYAGAYNGAAKEINVHITGGTFKAAFYCGNYHGGTASNAKKISTTVEGGTFEKSFFGGSTGVKMGDVHVVVKGSPVFKDNFMTAGFNKVAGSLTTADIVTGNVKLEIYGGSFKNIYSGTQVGTVGNVENLVEGGTVSGAFYCGYGGNMGTIQNTIKGGSFTGSVYLGSWAGSATCLDVTNNVSGGTFASSVYFAGSGGTATAKDIYNTLTGGTFKANAYMGGNLSKAGNITNVIGDAKGGPNFVTKAAVLYCGGGRSSSTVGNISNTFNNGTFRNVHCGSVSNATNGSVTNVINGGYFINSVTCSGYYTTNGKVLTTVNGGTFDEYLLAGGRGSINLPEGSEDYYCAETVINAGTFKGVWGGGEGTTTTRTGNTKLTVYGGTFKCYGVTDTTKFNALCAGGRGQNQVGNADVFIYGGTFDGEVCAGAYPHNSADDYARNSTGKATVTIYGGTFNRPILANSKWKTYSEGGTVILNPTESDIIINSTMVMRDDTDGAQSYQIVGGDHKIVLGKDAKIEATAVSGDVKIEQAQQWNAKVYVTLPQTHTANVAVSTASDAKGVYSLEKNGDTIVEIKGGMQLYGATMILTDRIAVRALFDKAAVEAYDDLSFAFTLNGETLAQGTKSDLAPWNENYYSIVLAKVGANDFTDQVIFDGGDAIWGTEFSIQGLAVLAETAWAGNEKGVALAKAIQNFASIVADPEAKLPHDLTPAKVEGFTASASKGEGTLFTATNKGLVMTSAVGIRIYGTATEEITAENLTITVNGKDVTEKAVIAAGENAGEYTIDLYVNAKNMSDPLNIVIAEKATGKVCLTLTDRVDAIAAAYGEDHKVAQQLLVYIQAAVEYSKA